MNKYVSPRIAGIAAVAINWFMGSVFLEETRCTVTVNDTPLEPEEVANGVVHPVTKKTITRYRQLVDDPIVREIWMKVMCKELRRLSQGYDKEGSDYHTEGTNTMRFLDYEGIDIE